MRRAALNNLEGLQVEGCRRTVGQFSERKIVSAHSEDKQRHEGRHVQNRKFGLVYVINLAELFGLRLDSPP